MLIDTGHLFYLHCYHLQSGKFRTLFMVNNLRFVQNEWK